MGIWIYSILKAADQSHKGHKSDKAVEVYIGNSLVQKLAAAQALSTPVPSFEEDDAAARGVIEQQ